MVTISQIMNAPIVASSWLSWMSMLIRCMTWSRSFSRFSISAKVQHATNTVITLDIFQTSVRVQYFRKIREGGTCDYVVTHAGSFVLIQNICRSYAQLWQYYNLSYCSAAVHSVKLLQKSWFIIINHMFLLISTNQTVYYKSVEVTCILKKKKMMPVQLLHIIHVTPKGINTAP